MLSKLLRHTIFYGFANGIEALIPFFFLILLTRYLSPEDYGVWTLFASLYAVVMPLLGLKLDDAIRMHFMDLNESNLSKFVNSIIFITTFLSLVMLCIAYQFSDFFSQITKFPAGWVWSIVVVAYLYSIFNILYSVYQFKGERVALGVIVFLKTLITLCATVAFVMSGLKSAAPIMGTMAGLLGGIMLSVVLFKLEVSLFSKIDRKYLGLLLKFGIFYFPTAIGCVIIPLTDRLFIAHTVGLDETGFYAIASLFGSALHAIVISSFLFAWLPWMFRLLKKNDKHSRKVASVATLLFYVGLPIVGLIVVQVSQFIAPYLMSENFLKATDYIFWLVMAAIANGYFVHNQGYLHFAKKATYMSICNIIAIVVNIILDYFWIKEFGTIGIAYATIAAYGGAAALSGIIAIYLMQQHKLITEDPL